MSSVLSDKRICVTGGAGFLGKPVCERLRQCGAVDLFVPRSSQFDLTRLDHTIHMLDEYRPNVIIHLAAQVGGIGANQSHPASFFHANMAMGLNLIDQARQKGVEKFVQIGSVCAYPKDCNIPFCEDDLWSGFPEETNAPYGVAKRALSVMIAAYRKQYGFNGIFLIPVNLYGPQDNFDPQTSHVIPALIRKFCKAVDTGEKVVTCWGSGRVTREFLYVDDAANAIVQAAQIHNDSAPINLGTGSEITITELASMIAELTGFTGDVSWDTTHPDGQPRRRLDTTRATSLLDWQAAVDLKEGLTRTIEWWRAQSA